MSDVFDVCCDWHRHGSTWWVMCVVCVVIDTDMGGHDDSWVVCLCCDWQNKQTWEYMMSDMFGMCCDWHRHGSTWWDMCSVCCGTWVSLLIKPSLYNYIFSLHARLAVLSSIRSVLSIITSPMMLSKLSSVLSFCLRLITVIHFLLSATKIWSVNFKRSE